MKIKLFIIFWPEFRQNLSKNEKFSKKCQFFEFFPIFSSKIKHYGLRALFPKACGNISCYKLIFFERLKKKFKKNNFFFEFGGPKPLMSVCLSETHFFCCRHGIQPIFGVFIQNLILRTMQVTKNYSDYFLPK